MAFYECPYAPGVEFVLVLADPADADTNESRCQVRVRVLQTFAFTKSQGMKVEILNASDGYKKPLPSHAFLKLYDRRYLDDRETDPWDHEKEARVMEVHRKFLEKGDELETHVVVKAAGSPLPLAGGQGQVDEFVIPTSDGCVVEGDPNFFHFFDKDDYASELESHMGSKRISEWTREMSYRYSSLSSFHTECRAYRQMSKFQGVCVPKFYGTVMFDDTSELLLGIDPDVPGILLEFIDGVSLEDIDIQSPLSTDNPHLAEAALVCFQLIKKRCGVIHDDLRLPNILVKKDGKVFVIDFAFVSFRGRDVTEEQWYAYCFDRHDDEKLCKMLLDSRGLRDRTPDLPYSNSRGDFRDYNRLTRATRESWRRRYYVDLMDPEYEDEPVVTEDRIVDGKLRYLQLPEFIPKWKALTERKRHLDDMANLYRELLEPRK
jgi:hypothetical protein